MKLAKNFILYALLLAGLAGCKKFIDIAPPVTQLTEGNVYASDITAIATITGIYSNLSSSVISGNAGFSIKGGLAADEFTLYSGVTDNELIAHYQNNLLSTAAQSFGGGIWRDFYYFIFSCNAAIEGLENSQSLTPTVQKQLLGEAKFLRAFFYFYLANYYGDACLALSTDPQVNGFLNRSPVSAVNDQVITDLKSAKELLSPNYLDGTLLKTTVDKVRPTKLAASALLARVYLYNKEYALAKAEATTVISTSTVLPGLDNAFLKNSQEAIWQLLPVVIGHNTEDGWTFIIPSTGPSTTNGSGVGYPVYLSSQLLNAFEAGDQRKAKWINSIVPTGSTTTYYFPCKYKSATANAPITEYQMVLRMGEQYLIRAEANAQLNLLNEAKDDLNVIRTRANLSNTLANTQQEVLDSILQERRVELFTEMSHRWFDLRRFGKIDEVMNVVTPAKANGLPWRNYQQLFPLPFTDLERNPNLVQNAEY
jgi:starch-binding outer membrane protein, SusD/RagB family